MGYAANHSRHNVGGKASPVGISQRNRDRSGRTVGGTSSIMRIKEGTTSRIVTRSLATSCSNCTGSRAASSLKMTTLPPTNSADKNCHTEISKHCDAFCATLSAFVSFRSHTLAYKWFNMPFCSTIAPFGVPVEPEVKITYAKSSRVQRTGKFSSLSPFASSCNSSINVVTTSVVFFEFSAIASFNTASNSPAAKTSRVWLCCNTCPIRLAGWNGSSGK